MESQQGHLDEVRTALLWAQVAMRFLATRVVSILSLAGGVALGFYAVWHDNGQYNWQGVAVFAIYAALIFRECVKSEDRARDAQRTQ